jgi:hypothetical protein
MAGNVKLTLLDMRKFPLYMETKQHFLVKSVTNSTGFEAGSYISKQRVDQLLDLGVYDIIINAFTEADTKKYNIK